jgi:O-antigen ligase/tetratricopeptide (TPR) repeat protein
MTFNWRFIVVVFFLIGFLLIGMIGTSTAMTFVWPAYACMGFAGLLSIGLLFKEVTFTLPRWSTIAMFALAAYLLVCASETTISYFAREDATLVLIAFLTYCLFLSLFSAIEWRRRLVQALALLVIVNLVFAALQAFVNPTLWLIPGYERTFSDRVGGLFNHPDHFAAFIAMLVPVWLGMSMYGRKGGMVRYVWMSLAAVSAFVVLATGSAVGILALSVGLGIGGLLSLLILFRKIKPHVRRSLLLGTATVFVVLSTVGLFYSASIGGRIDYALLTKGDGASLPLIWKAGLKQVEVSPMLGTGSRTSQVYTRLFRDDSLHGAEPEFIHNEYLQMLADYGIIGLLLLSVVLLCHGRSGLKFVKAYAAFGTSPGALLPKSDHLALVIGALSALGALGVVCLFDFEMHLPVFVVTASVLIAVLAVPDPMATAIKPAQESATIPGGSLMLVNRAAVFGAGIAMLLFGIVFSRSEYHYEMARLSFDSDRSGFQHMRHLQEARTIDPKNPYILTLSAHAQVAGITPEMPAPARTQALEKADLYFTKARDLYPEDIFAAIGHAAVLDELGHSDDAIEILREARAMAPVYGNLMLAEAEHYLRIGKIEEAEEAYTASLNANAFRDSGAAGEGLLTITGWKLIAEQNGIDWRSDILERRREAELAKAQDYRSMPAALIRERELASEAAAPSTTQENPDSPQTETETD